MVYYIHQFQQLCKVVSKSIPANSENLKKLNRAFFFINLNNNVKFQGNQSRHTWVSEWYVVNQKGAFFHQSVLLYKMWVEE